MDKKVLETMLNKKTTLSQLKKFIKAKKLKPTDKSKKGIIDFLVNSIQLKEEDFESLQEIAFGPREDKGFSAYICQFNTNLTINKFKEKINEISRFITSDSPFRLRLLALESSRLEILCEFTEKELTLDIFTNKPTFGADNINIVASFDFKQYTVMFFSGSYDHCTEAAINLNNMLPVNIRPLTIYKKHITNAISYTEDSLTLLFLDFILNRLSTIGKIEKVEGIDFEPIDTENIRSIKHKGESVLSDPETCRLISMGHRVVGFRVYFMYITAENRVIYTHISLVFKEKGTKISVAKKNYKLNDIEELFNKVKDLYIDMYVNGPKNIESILEFINKIRERAKEVS
ncbi:hypothetical protein GFC01_06145 [Desulfofundulus thermobenzoicus]|uniref:Uncharacterized protein n=1 Tax=Desulfofundulus thermobenzoicus TaxID=29376 RepID=A0A6N7IPL1_9FIRM|nr:hypothetical protein [Desulfofundulus thermobenzoicus]MQL51851.1 hypothetical protein [Desulfofundulus thermobenzoicus]